MADPFRVLIIDDDWISARILEKLLGMRGCATKIVINGVEALGELRQFKPDAVTVDSSMPGIDGYQVARLIRSEPSFERVPIVSVSAFDDEKHKLRAEEAGIDHVLSKPVDINALCRFLSVPEKPDPETARLTPQERTELQGKIASVNSRLNTAGISGEEWRKLHEERHALEQKLQADN